MLHSDETRTLQISLRLNAAEKKMIEEVNKTIRPRISVNKMLIYLCEERARELGIIQDDGEGNWLISE